MGSEGHTVSMLFFPLMAQGHMLPMLDIAKLFAMRGVKATILTTPANAPLVQPFIDRANANSAAYPMSLQLIPFPSDAGLPEGCENLSSIPSREMPSLRVKFFGAMSRLREPFEWALGELLPDCVMTDMFLPWTYEVAAELGIPRLVFHGTNFFYLCVADSLSRHKPLESLPAEAETLVIPGLPHRIRMLRSQIPSVDEEAQELFRQIRVSDSKSYGVVVNSFYELEPDYARHYREVVGRRAWHIGPVALCNRDNADKSGRGYKAAIDRNDCLKWLDSKSAGSVLYVCFGSMSDFGAGQLREIALGLEASSHPFVWAVRSDGEEWIPEGFEERVEGRGLVIRGWAPQILILNHPSVGGFLTHCGWNSSLEGVSAGLPLVTWPLFAEQFYNERLIVDVLKIGVPVGVKEHAVRPEERALVDAAKIKNAAEEVMGSGGEAQERRRRARELGEAARRAVGKGGSSYKDMSNLIQELMDKKNASLSLQNLELPPIVSANTEA